MMCTLLAAGLVLNLLIATVAPRRAAAPTPDDLPRLATGFENTGRARVTAGGHTYVLARPRVAPAGLAFDKVEGPARPAVVTSAWDTVPAPQNPIGWERIDRIDVQMSHRTRNALVGGGVGMVVSALGLFALVNAYHDGAPTADQVFLFIGAGTLAGAGLGVILTTPYWRQLHPAPAP
jgi:hypothetical protein